MIQGNGYTSARVMLIGDGASEEDIGTGYALSGQAENILKGLCADNKLSLREFYKTHLIKERINLRKPLDNQHLITQEYVDILKNEIRAIKPHIIVPLSELGFTFITTLSGIRKFRGSVLPSRNDITGEPIRVIPILGPSPYLYEDPKLNFISRLDFSKVAKNLNEEGPIKEIGCVWIAKNAEQVRGFFKRYYQTSPFVIFDIETYFGIPTCISFCFDGNESMTVPLLDRTISFDSRGLMLHEVAILLNSPIPKVNQNIKFDWKKLSNFCFNVSNVSGDTMLAASLLYPEFPKNLGFLTSIYTDMPYFKDEGHQFDPQHHDRSRLYLYCAKDSLATHKIYTQQLVEMEEMGVKKVYDTLIDIMPIYKRMEERGIRIDMMQRLSLWAKYESLFNINKRKFQILVNDDKANPLSDDQVRAIVYEELEYHKIRGVKTTKAGYASTDEESLELLMWMGSYKSNILDGREILRTIIDCRKLHKVLEYLESPLHPDERARCEFNLGGAETGRTTSGKTTDNYLYTKGKNVKITDLGRSFQNIGKHGFELGGVTLGQELRSIFVPSHGYCFVECDLSQAEARVDAVLASDYDILSIFDGPVGIHRLTGSWIYNCDPGEIKKNNLVDGVDRYHLAKTARHAGERNMKEDRLMMMIHRSLIECRKILGIFHDKQPNIRGVFHKDIYNQIQKHRCLVAPSGRRRDFFGRFDTNTVNEGISFLPQAVVTDLMKQSLKKTFDECPWAMPLSEAHDGFLSEVPLGKKEEYALCFKKNIEVPIDFNSCSLSRDFKLTIPMEAEWSMENWQRMKKLL